ncbi:MAG: flagellar basal-body MS-ring/collar protein FliF [Clostridia bacterium]|nr:flagellar basal-body MS-ring/collar protein FliF [Clostridia bacterium]
MPEALSRLQQQLVELWKNLDKSQKNRIFITSAILIVAITIGIVALTRPSYITLIKNADPKEVGEMTKILDDKKIWNRVENGGNAIVINSRDNSRAQAALVQSGYPKSTNMTFDDAFKMIKLNTTESDKKRLWEEYKANSLSAKLKALDNVEYADVTLAMPEPDPFVSKDEQRTTANVVVKPRSELSPKQVQGIIMMVARSVENLNPKDISVVDTNLMPLNSEENEATVPGSQYDMKQKVKRDLEKSVRDIFSGYQFDSFDAIRVVANPVLDFNPQKQTEKIITNPEGREEGAVVSNREIKESVKNAGAKGVPGTESNPGNQNSPTYQIGTGGDSTYEKKQTETNYQHNEKLVESSKALGVMDPEKSSMTVSLMYGKRVLDDSKITPEIIQQIKQDVSLATGIAVSKVSVSKYKIAPPEIEKKQLADTVKEIFNTYGLFAVILLLAIGSIIMAITRSKKEPELELAAQTAGSLTGSKFAAPDAHEEYIQEIDLEERSEVKKQIEKFVKQKPEAVASLLRNWLSQDWD